MDIDLAEVQKFVALGYTFESHAPGTYGWPAWWIEPAECLIPSGETVQIPPDLEAVGIGPELTVVIGEELYRPTSEAVSDAIAGFTVSNDVSAVGDWPGHPHETTLNRAYKMFPTFRPTLTEGVEMSLEDANHVEIEAFIDGESVGSAAMSEARWSVSEMIAEVASVMPLHPGDLIALGEPISGTVEDSATVTCRIDGVGELTNPVQRV